jgi:hypothetical protein
MARTAGQRSPTSSAKTTTMGMLAASAGIARFMELGARGLHHALTLRTTSRAGRTGHAAIGLCALLLAAVTLAQGVPGALRATHAEMDRVAARLAASGASIVTTLVLYDEFVGGRSGTGRTRIDPATVAPLAPELRERFAGARTFLSRRSVRDLLTVKGLIPRFHDFARELTADRCMPKSRSSWMPASRRWRPCGPQPSSPPAFSVARRNSARSRPAGARTWCCWQAIHWPTSGRSASPSG